jgi:hypothetical protein
MEVEEKMEERCREMEGHFTRLLEKHASDTARHIGEMKREVVGLGSSDSLKDKLSKMEQDIESQTSRIVDHEDKNDRDKQEIRNEIRSSQAATFSHMSDIETNLKRQIQQFESHTRELRSLMFDAQRTTKEQVEEVERQNSSLLTQLKRSILEHQNATDEHTSASKRVESELQALQSKVRLLQRGHESMEIRYQEGVGGVTISRPEQSGIGRTDMNEVRAAIDAVQRQFSTALDNETRQTEQRLVAMRDLLQSKLELEMTKTHSRCEKMVHGAEDSLARESAARLELDRDLKAVSRNLMSSSEQHEVALGALRRHSNDIADQLGEETKLREESERGQLAQQRMANLRLEEEVTQRVTAQVSAQIATALATQVDQARQSPSTVQQPPAQHPAERPPSAASEAKLDRCIDRLETCERELSKSQHDVQDLRSSVHNQRQPEPRPDLHPGLAAQIQDVVGVCGSVTQEFERAKKELHAQHTVRAAPGGGGGGGG